MRRLVLAWESLVLSLPSSMVYAQAPPTIEIQALIRDFQERTEPGGHPDF